MADPGAGVAPRVLQDLLLAERASRLMSSVGDRVELWEAYSLARTDGPALTAEADRIAEGMGSGTAVREKLAEIRKGGGPLVGFLRALLPEVLSGPAEPMTVDLSLVFVMTAPQAREKAAGWAADPAGSRGEATAFLRLMGRKAESYRLAMVESIGSPPPAPPPKAAPEPDDLDRRLQARLDAERKSRTERINREKAQAEGVVDPEAERVAREKAEAEKEAREREEAERAAREKAEAERVAGERAEAERAAREEAGRIAREKAEAERVAREKAEAERVARERVEAERIARVKAEAERVARERAAAEKAEAERLAREKAEAERVAREKAEAERVAREKAEAERLAREKAEAERLAREKAEAERIAREKAEAERVARERAAAEKAQAERIAREKAEAERIARERAEAERVAREKAEAERVAREKAEAERIAREKAEAIRLVREKADALLTPEARAARDQARAELRGKLPGLLADPWRDQKPGAWFRVKAVVGAETTFTDLGLRERGAGFTVLGVQQCVGGRSEWEKWERTELRSVECLGQELLDVAGTNVECDVYRLVSRAGEEKLWIALDAPHAGAAVRSESPGRAFLAKKLGAEKLAVGNREFECVKCEGEETTAGKTAEAVQWWSMLYPLGPVKSTGAPGATEAVRSGDNWNNRPPFPS